MVRSAWTCALLTASLALSGCGGGGDSDTPIDPAVSAALIDSQSAPLIAAEVAGAISGSQELGTLGAFSIPAVPGGVAGAGKDVPQTLAATFGPEVVDCAVSGYLELSGSQAVSDSVTVGDQLMFEFFDCDNGDGALVDGLLEFEIVSFAGDLATGQMTLTVSMTLEALSFGGEPAAATMNGNLSFTIDTTNVPETFIAISSSMFSIASSSGSVTLSDYISTIAVDPIVGFVTIDSSATLRASAFEGEISYVTTESLVLTTDGTPVSGLIAVNGADGATLTIRILSADHVELEIDLDGNGTIDEVIVTTWTELID